MNNRKVHVFRNKFESPPLSTPQLLISSTKVRTVNGLKSFCFINLYTHLCTYIHLKRDQTESYSVISLSPKCYRALSISGYGDLPHSF